MDNNSRQEKYRKCIHLFLKCNRLHHALIESKVSALGLHRSQHTMLLTINHIGNISQKELAQSMEISPAAVTVTLKKLEAQGYIERSSSSSDSRVNNITITEKGREITQRARAEGRRIIVLAGRPYHIDPEVNHGIDTLITRAGAAVLTEDSVSCYVEKFPTHVLNQWTYHSRLYAAARYCCSQPDMDLVQLVSFGCGVDAITTDETRSILHEGGKLYTQLKIDEITNLGAVKIRLRSLFAALEERQEDAR